MGQFKTKHGYEGLLVVIEGTDAPANPPNCNFWKNLFKQNLME